MRRRAAIIAVLAGVALPAGGQAQVREDALAGSWRAAVDQAGGPLRFALRLERDGDALRAMLCNGPDCNVIPVTIRDGGVVFDIQDFDATITATLRRGPSRATDSLVGTYQNVGNRGPRVIPFRASRGTWPVTRASDRLAGSWDAELQYETRTSPRVFLITNGRTGIEGAVLSNSGGSGQFWGSATAADSLDLGRFDGTFVYRVTAALEGDTLRGVFHAGLRTQTPFVAVRSTGRAHLTPALAVTGADTTERFRFAFPDLDGRIVTQNDPRFRGRVVMVDIFGSWCTTCHDAAPTLVRLYEEYRDRGLAAVGLAYEVTGDSAIDARQVRRFRAKHHIPWTLLLAGLNLSEATAATLPQLRNFTAYPTTVFLGRDGRVRKVHAGFLGPAAGPLHDRQVEEFRSILEELLAEPGDF